MSATDSRICECGKACNCSREKVPLLTPITKPLAGGRASPNWCRLVKTTEGFTPRKSKPNKVSTPDR